MTSDRNQATFGGGCFWCTEAVFEMVKGVTSVEPGYSGGHVENPTYEEVCGKRTGHVEVIRFDFEPAVVSYKQLVELFLVTHDPTTRDRQGNDAGPQYRSVIFTHDDEQARVANEVIAELTAENVFGKPIVTEALPLTTYFTAEGYHHGYFRANPGNSYCAAVIGPKVSKARAKYAGLLA